jgi:ribonuclease HI
MLIEVYTDGSATTAEKPGGYGYVVCVNGVKVHEGSGHLLKATNTVAEVTAAIRGLTYVATTDVPGISSGAEDAPGDGTRVVLISDSQLTLNWATGNYRCKQWHLIPLVIELRKIFIKLNAETRWVKGHNGDEHNERCDVLAGEARQDPTRADS